MLSLILLQARTYADIAILLRLPDDDVRKRAHAAAKHLVDSNAAPAPAVQEQVIDYLLGEQAVSEREQTRSILQDDPVAREWAAKLVDGLSPLAKGNLPAIPEAPAKEPAPAPVDDEPVAPEPVQPVIMVTAPSAEPPQPVVMTTAPSKEPSPQRTRPRGRLLALALGTLAIAVAIVIVVVASGGGGSHQHSSTTQLVLTPVAGGSSAGGSATVQRQNGGLLMELSAHGLAPNTHSNSYAVWLYNTPSDALLLGFASPPVGPSGAFKNGAALPRDASRFHMLLVTVETVQQPAKPGTIVLRAPLTLP